MIDSLGSLRMRMWQSSVILDPAIFGEVVLRVASKFESLT